jgi:hypothetical protein
MDGLASYDGDSRRNEGAARRERRAAGLPLDDLAPEALPLAHACGCGQPQAPAGLPRRVAFPYNRRKTNGVGRIPVRVIERLVARHPLTMRSLIDNTKPPSVFRSAHPA